MTKERASLYFLLSADLRKEQQPVVPFGAFRDEIPCQVNAVLERTAVCQSLTDEYDRVTVPLDRVFVNPMTVEWEPKSPLSGAPARRGGRFRSYIRGTRETGADARANSDKRALKNQQEVAQREEAEKAALAVSALKHAREVSGVSTTNEEREMEPILVETPSNMKDSGNSSPAAPVLGKLLKFCPGCRQEKPRSEFPAGKGFFQCNDCRSARTDAAVAVDEKAVKRQQLAQQGLKHCPRCEQDKPFDGFNKNATKADGYQATCKDCQSAVWTTGATAVRRAKNEGLQPSEPGVIQLLEDLSHRSQEVVNNEPIIRTPKSPPALTEELGRLLVRRDEGRVSIVQLQATDAAITDRIRAVLSELQEALDG